MVKTNQKNSMERNLLIFHNNSRNFSKVKIPEVMTQEITQRESSAMNAKDMDGDYTDESVKCYECEGYGHIASKCANTQKKQNGKTKALNVTWSDSDSESESTTKYDVLEKYDDLLTVSQKLNKHNRELAKRVAVLELENSRTARTLQSSAAEPDIMGEEKIEEKRGLGFDSINKSSAISITKFVKPSLPTGAPTSQTT
ncbi:unnamed protein product [Prunus armeniaca]